VRVQPEGRRRVARRLRRDHAGAAMKRKASKPEPAAEPGEWRIVRGDKVVASFKTPELARNRFHTLSRSILGHGAKLLKPSGVEDDGRDDEP